MKEPVLLYRFCKQVCVFAELMIISKERNFRLLYDDQLTKMALYKFLLEKQKKHGVFGFQYNCWSFSPLYIKKAKLS